MKNKYQDARYTKTEQNIRLVFIDLIKTIGYSKITISKIIDSANINRSTFYDHYIDKEDLIDHMQLELIQQLTENLPDINVYNLNNHEIVNGRIETIIERIYIHKEIIQLYASNKSDGLFFNRFSNFSEKLLIQTDLIDEINIPEVYAFSVIEGVMVNLIQTWIKRDFIESPEYFSKVISDTLPNLFRNLIN